MTRDEDLKLTEWGIKTFLESTGRKPSMFMIGAHYADSNPTTASIVKTMDLYFEAKSQCDEKDIDWIKYVKEHWNDSRYLSK